MTLPFKLSSGTLIFGSFAGIGYFSTSYFYKNDQKISNKSSNKLKISELIEKEFKYVPLDTKTDDLKINEFWKTNWESYSRDNATNDVNKDSFQLVGWRIGNKENLTQKLKEKCENLFSNTISENSDAIYKSVEKYCTRGVTVEEDAKKKGLSILDTNVSGKNAKIWEKRAQAKTSLSAALGKIGVSLGGEQLTKEVISKGCETAKSKNKKEQEYYLIYEAYEKICTKQVGDPE